MKQLHFSNLKTKQVLSYKLIIYNIIIPIILLLSFIPPVYSQVSGTIDTTFNYRKVSFNNILDKTYKFDGFNSDAQINQIIVQPNGKLLVAGQFNSYRGRTYNNIIRLNQDGTVDMSFNPGSGADNRILAMVLQPDGKILIAGEFNNFNNKSSLKLVRLNQDGSFDNSFQIGTYIIGGAVRTIALQPDNKIIIGGDFTSYNGASRNYIARINSDGSLDATFNPGTGANAPIYAIAIQVDFQILIGGNFGSYNGSVKKGLARLNPNGSLDNTFLYAGISNVNSIAIQPDNKILIGGIIYNPADNNIIRLNMDGSRDVNFQWNKYFGNVSNTGIKIQTDGKILFFGNTFDKLYRLNVDGSTDNTFNLNFKSGYGSVKSIAQINGKTYLGWTGLVVTTNNDTLSPLISINADNSIEQYSFGNGQPNGAVYTIAKQLDGKILIGGAFTSYNGIFKNHIARLNIDGTLDETFSLDSAANNDINVIILQNDGKILVGGAFARYNRTSKNGLVRLNTDGSLDASFNIGSGPDRTIRSILLLPDDKILIGGNFTTYNGIGRKRIARLNTDGSIDPSFNSSNGADNDIYSIALQTDGNILIAGNFSSYGGTNRVKIARVTSTGSLDVTFNSNLGLSGIIYKVIIQNDNKILIGGSFRSNSGNNAAITRLNFDGSFDGNFPIYDGSVVTIALQYDDKIIVSGSVLLSGSNVIKGLGRLNIDGSVDTTFNNSKVSGGINSILLNSDFDGNILIGGSFTQYDGINRQYLAKLNRNGQLRILGANNAIYKTKLLADGSILIAGAFTGYNGSTRNRITKILSDGFFDYSFYSGSGANNSINSIIIQPDDKILIAGGFTSYDGTIRNRVARINSDGSIDSTFNPGTGANDSIHSMALLPDGRILIAGQFTAYNGTPKKGVARLNSDGSLDVNFSTDYLSPSSIYFILPQPDGKVLVGGSMSTPNGVRTLIRLNSDGSEDFSFSNSFKFPAYPTYTAALQNDGKILLGGTRFNLGSDRYCKLVRVNSNGIWDSTFQTETFPFFNNFYSDDIRSIVSQQDGKILIAGNIYYFNSKEIKSYIARLNPDGSYDESFYTIDQSYKTIFYNNSPSFNARCIEIQPDNKIILAGSFNQFQGYNMNNIVRLNNALITPVINLNPKVICAGSSFTVSFTTTQGTFDAGNKFYAELSDSLGKFTNNVTLIGTLTSSSNSASITCTIPSNISSGTQYQIRIKSTCPYILAITGPIQIVNLNKKPNILSITGTSCVNSFGSFGSLVTLENIPGTTYNWSSGQSGNPIRIASSGQYNLTISHPTCSVPKTYSYDFVINQITNCAGSLILEPVRVVNYFDTITVKVKMQGGDNLFSVFAKLSFENDKLILLNSQVGNYLGNNIINTPAVVNGNTINFGMTKTSGQSGTNGDGLIYTFQFKLKTFPNLVFDNQNPPLSFTTFKLNSPVINDANGALRTVNLNPLPDTTYLRYYVPVWPGDLNNDKVCDVADLLPIGYFYNSTGPARPNNSLQWQAQPALIWSIDNSTLGSPSPAYKVFADGNGDGIVDLADQTSIGFNIRKTHARLKPDFEEPSNIINNIGVPITVDITDTLIPRAQLPKNITARINLGTSDNPFSNLYGFAFDLFFNPSYVDINNITFNYTNTIFGSIGADYIKIEDNASSTGRISIGLTRYNTTELSGFGKVMEVTFPIKQNGPGNYFKVFAIPKAANNKSGSPIAISEGRDSVRVDQIITGIKQTSTNSSITKIYPNPTSNEINVDIQTKQSTDIQIKIIDLKGAEMYSKKIVAPKGQLLHTINVSDYPKGLYIIQLIDKEGTATNKILVE